MGGMDAAACRWWPWMRTEDEHWGQAVLHTGKHWKPVVFPVQLFISQSGERFALPAELSKGWHVSRE